ncbi:cell wall / vacuolar inhibitor of fructosidase 1 [Nicotiana tabacum]|uniref:Cell wall / vacuolar inhibitor of fructosidase 1 n=1 Tax=Nicotiana tabacum TaxID=4097 RepID=O49909_TOBAC|nr:cell wall / vacuolar inhibitor of fructosidase 1-like [Nicotiana tomentosiformis]XP_016469931.1 PREDICTED: cell wall / vacuolar inhibitor of fructosidase 1-like [Nicotiana tabacum]AAN60076.1 vacuolar invertase inhibitor [Nicotiana tabacum]AAT01640.1 invertase inhibitor [Nicotiana tabacum]CAA73334.1 invertase inhibitor homologue [Nicotiana tabacum]
MRNLFPIFMLITNLAFNDNNNSNNIINTTCRATTNYPLCLTTLHSDPRTSEAEGADLTTLGLVMVDAVKLKSIEIMKSIKKLEKSNPELRLPLSQCYIVYYAVLHADVTVAVEALKRGVPKFAENGMVDVAVEAETCEFSFKYNGLVSPVSDMNKEIIELSSVAKSIIRMLL